MFVVCRVLLAATVLGFAYVLVAYSVRFPALGLVFAAVLAIALARRRGTRLSAMGTARWAGPEDIPHLQEGYGIVLGHMAGRVGRWAGTVALFDRRQNAAAAVRTFLTAFQGRRQPRPLVRLTDAVHTAVFAPSGAGKNVSIVEPFLLTSLENAFCIDFKGENARITAAHRARAFGHKVVLLDPFQVVTATPATWNVLDTIDPADPEAIDQIRAIAEAIIVKEPNARDPHWSQKAEIFLTGVVAAVLHFCPPGRRSLQEVAATMANKALLAEAIGALRGSAAHGGLLTRLGDEMAISTDKELDGILSTANRSLAFLSTPAVAESTRATAGFDVTDLDRGVTGYLILPARYARSHAGLMRLWCTALFQAVVARGVGGGRPLNVILDEAATLGPMEAVTDMLTIGRGYGIKLTLIYQGMSQLKRSFPDGQEGVLLANTTQVFFAVQDNETAKYVSERLGDYTQVVTGGGTNDGRSWSSPHGGQGGSAGYSTGGNTSWSQTARRLLQPSEVAALDPRVAVCFHPGVSPIATTLCRYYERDNGLSPRPPMGRLKIVVDTLCLFLTVVFLAVLVTGGLLTQHHDEGEVHVPGNAGGHRATQGRGADVTRGPGDRAAPGGPGRDARGGQDPVRPRP
ncbi:MAG TPA: type IV secretory system conjugative DNA transfer family protein [Urbifossiella sp.]|nr:type IV secretory system conjugative DNA transfer family protein [Urbifossiella sp.]